jgi:hypothetical protein
MAEIDAEKSLQSCRNAALFVLYITYKRMEGVAEK